MIAWMQNWNAVGAKLYQCRWFGQMTLPRELSLKDGRLIQNPVRELEAYRGARVIHQNIPVCGQINLSGMQGRVLDMTVTVCPIGPERYRWFRIRVTKDGKHEMIIRYRPDQGSLKLNRMRASVAPKVKAISAKPRLKFLVPRPMNDWQGRKECPQCFPAFRYLFKLRHHRNLLAGCPSWSAPAA